MFNIYLLLNYVHVCACMFLCTMCVQVPVEARRMLDPLEQELSVVINYLMWMLRTKPVSSVRVINALNIRAILPTRI